MDVRRVLVGFAVAVLAMLAPQLAVRAQSPGGELALLHAQWREARDPEQRIALGENLLEHEEALSAWPLSTPRDQFKAEILFELASAYLVRPRGPRADNIEKAIGHFEAVLKLWTLANETEGWARAHNNAGLAYWSRVRGERTENQERAIAHFEAALKVFTRDGTPREWAQLQNNLAIVRASRILGDGVANTEQAIAHFEGALAVFTRESDPLLWASAQNNLGSIYRSRRSGDRADNREKAIAYIEAALGVFTRETTPHEWASARYNLAVIYLERDRGTRTDNEETALEHLEGALSVFTKETFPHQWAKAQIAVGDVYSDRVRGLTAGNRQLAIAAYEDALTVFTRDADPREHLRAGRKLGRMLLQNRSWHLAGEVLESAREAFLVLFGEGIAEADARALIADAGPLFAEAAFAAIQRGDNEAALALADEGRARLLAVALRIQSLDVSADERRRLDELRAGIRDARNALETATNVDRGDVLDRIAAQRKALLALVAGGGSGDGRRSVAIAEARRTAAAGGAVVMPVVTGLGGKLIVVTPPVGGTDIAIVDLPDLTPARLSELLAGPPGQPAGGWIAAYFVNYLEGEEQARRWPEWLASVDRVGPALWRLLGARLDAVLKERNVRSGAPIVWLPSGWLGVLPLGLAQHPVGKQRLADDYVISIAPSLETLAAARRQAEGAGPPTLAAIVNPTGDLPGADKEGEFVASHFAPENRQMLIGEYATPNGVLAALKTQTHWHFASHGTFSWSDVRQSALVMHGPARLTIDRLQAVDGLARPRLVVLSACETGLIEITANPDEFIGLPGTFMALGAAGIVGTLWPVNDTATALLMARFYELHIGERLAPAIALSRAQAWLRTATSVHLQAYIENAVTQARIAPGLAQQMTRELSPEELRRSRNSAAVEWLDRRPADRAKRQSQSDQDAEEARPFAHPYFWAGFVHTGI